MDFIDSENNTIENLNVERALTEVALGTDGVKAVIDTVTKHVVISGAGTTPYFGNTSPLKSHSSNIYTIEVKKEVKGLGGGLCYGLSNLTSVTFEKESQCAYLGAIGDVYGIFESCSKLQIVEIPSSTTTLGRYFLSGCSKLTLLVNRCTTSQTVGSNFNSTPSTKPLPVYGYTTNTKFKALFSNATNYTWNEGTSYANFSSNEVNFDIDILTKELTISGTGEMDALNTWTSTTYPLLQYVNEVNGVVVEEGVTKIGNYCFLNCVNLKYVKLPNSLTKLNPNAFEGCTSLDSINLPENISEIGGSCFKSCSAITSIVNKCGVSQTIGTEAFLLNSTSKPVSVIGLTSNTNFRNCFSNTSDFTWTEYVPPFTISLGGSVRGELDIASGILTITGTGATDDWTASNYPLLPYKDIIKSVNVGNGVTTIGSYCFYDCTQLSSVSFSNSITSLGVCAFKGCSALPKIGFNEGITTIGVECFSGCKALSSISLPPKLTSISNKCFLGCASLNTATIPNALQTIEASAFEGCTNLTELDIPETTTSLGDFCFKNCVALKIFVNRSTSSQTIGASIFEGMSSVVAEIFFNKGNVAFKGVVSSVSSFILTEDIPIFIKISDTIRGLYFSATKHLIVDGSGEPPKYASSGASPISKYPFVTAEIKEGITKISSLMFYGAVYLKLIVIPNSVKTVGEGSFYCPSLKTIVSKSTTSQTFEVGWSSTKFDFHSKNVIDVYGLSSNSGLKNLASDGNFYKWHVGIPDMFEMGESIYGILDSTDDGNLVIDGVGDMYNWTQDNYPLKPYLSRIKNIFIGNAVTSIGSHCFRDCNSIVEIQNAYKYNQKIGLGAFSFTPSSAVQVYGYSSNPQFKGALPTDSSIVWNEDLKPITISYGVNVKGIYYPNTKHFVVSGNGNCANVMEEYSNPLRNLVVETVEVQEGVTSLCTYMFHSVKPLLSISLPTTLARIEAYAFNSSGLMSIDIPNSVTVIGNYAFGSCRFLTSISLPNGITTLGNSIFSSCSNLISAVLPESLTAIPNNLFSSCDNLNVLVNKCTTPQSFGSGWYSSSAIFYVYGHSSNTTLKELTDGTARLVWVEGTTVPNIEITGLGEGITCVLDQVTATATISGVGNTLSFTSSNSPFLTHKDIIGTVKVQEGVTGLGNNLFYKCARMTSISLPDGLTSLGEQVFTSCSCLKTVNLPQSLTTISRYCFSYTTNLYSVVVPSGVKTLTGGVFSNSSIEYAIIPEGVQVLGANAFYSAQSLREISLPNSITTIYSGCFSNTNIERAYIPSGSIEYECFQGNRVLTYIELGENVTEIGSNFVSSTTILETLINRAKDPQSLTAYSLTCPSKNVKVYGYSSNTTFKQRVEELPDTYIWHELETECRLGANIVGAFNEATGHLTIAGSGAMYDWQEATYPLRFYKDSIKTVSISSGITSLGAYCFYGCTALKEVEIPNSVMSVGDNCFNGCSAITTIKNKSTISQMVGVNAFVLNSTVKPVQVHGYSTNTNFKNAVSNTTNFTWNDMPIEVQLGTSVMASLNGTTGHLTISGTGAMDNNWTQTEYPLLPYIASIKTVEIQTGVTNIGQYCFYKCSVLTSISIPNSVVSIGDRSFDNCKKLASIAIPNSVNNIGANCFNLCSALKDVTLPTNLTTLSASTFVNCGALASITLPTSITNIGESCFRNCGSLASITLPNGISTLNDSVFSGCTMLTSVTLSSGIQSIGANVFVNCVSLPSITIPEGVSTLGANAFEGCSSLSTIAIPKTVSTIGFSCYLNCSSVTTIYNYTKTPQNIESDAFSLGSRVKPVQVYGYSTNTTFKTITSDTTDFAWNEGMPPIEITLGDYIVGKLKDETGHLVIEGIGDMPNWYASSYPLKNYISAIKTVEIKQGITSIGNYCFRNCSQLTAITIPSGITTVGDYSFYGCSSLSAITLLTGVASIGGHAFEDCSSLSSVVLPDSVASLGASSFRNCSGLVNFTMPNGIKTLGEYCFYNCSALTTVSMPSLLTSIGDYCFRNCSLLNSITIFENTTNIGTYAFYNCHALALLVNKAKTSQTIGVDAFSLSSSTKPVQVYGYSTNTNFKSATSNTTDFTWNEGMPPITIQLGANVVGKLYEEFGRLVIEGTGSMNNWTYSNYPLKNYKTIIKTVEIQKGITGIGSACFYACSNLTTVTFEENSLCTRIGNISDGDGVFERCEKLAHITLPSGLTIIGGCCFNECTLLNNIEIPQGVLILPRNAFSNCSALTSIVIPPHVSKIDRACFLNCTSLTSIDIPSSVTYIGAMCFKYCSKVTEIINRCTISQTIPTSDAPNAVGSEAFLLESITKPVQVYGYSSNTKFKSEVSNTADFTWNEGMPPVIVQLGANVVAKIKEDIKHVSIEGTGAMNNWIADTYPLARYKDSFETVEIKEGVTNIGDYCFFQCTNLVSVSIAQSVTTMGIEAFDGCSKLSSVNIPSNMTYISDYCFSGCGGLTSITLPEGIISLGNYSFYQCTALQTIALPSGLVSLGRRSFQGCSALKELNLPKNISSIGEQCFYECVGLTKILNHAKKSQTLGINAFGIVPTNSPIEVYGYSLNATFKAVVDSSSHLNWNEGIITSFSLGDDIVATLNDVSGLLIIKGTGAMYNWDSSSYPLLAYKDLIQTVEIQNGITSLGDACFYNCTAITSITIPASVTKIGNLCFYDCVGVTSMTMENGIVTLGDYAFYGCANITSLTLPHTITSIGVSCLQGCRALNLIVNRAKTSQTIGRNAFTLNSTNPPVKIHGYTSNATFKNAVVNPNNFTWNEGMPIIEMQLGDTVTGYFNEDTKQLTVSGTGDMYNWVGSGDSPVTPYINGIETVDIQNGVTSVGSFMLSATSPITTIIIARSVTTIRDSAFVGCRSLTRLTNGSLQNQTVGNSILLASLPQTANIYGSPLNTNFKNKVVGVTNVVWHDLAFDIPLNFKNNISGVLDEITNTLTVSGSGIMGNFTETTSPVLPYVDIIHTIVIQEGITGIGDYCFYNCSRSTSTTIPTSITQFGDSCFSGCSGIGDLTFNSTQTLGRKSFYASSVTNVHFNLGVQEIPEGFMGSAPNLVSVEIPSSVLTVGKSAFRECGKLRTIYNNAHFNQTFVLDNGLHPFHIASPQNVVTVQGRSTNANFKGLFTFGDMYSWEEIFIVPSIPQNLRVRSENNVIYITWDKTTETIGYNVYVDGECLTTTLENHYEVHGELGGLVSVRSYSQDTESIDSNKQYFSTVPNEPLDVKLEPIANSLKVNFLDNSYIETAYRVKYQIDNNSQQTVELTDDYILASNEVQAPFVGYQLWTTLNGGSSGIIEINNGIEQGKILKGQIKGDTIKNVELGLSSVQAIIDVNGTKYSFYASEEDKINQKIITLGGTTTKKDTLELKEDGTAIYTQNTKDSEDGNTRVDLITPIVINIAKTLVPTIQTSKINILSVDSPVKPSYFEVTAPTIKPPLKTSISTTSMAEKITVNVEAYNSTGTSTTTQHKVYLPPSFKWTYVQESSEVLLSWTPLSPNDITSYKVKYKLTSSPTYSYKVVNVSDIVGDKAQCRLPLNNTSQMEVSLCACVSNSDGFYTEAINVSKDLDVNLIPPQDFNYRWVEKGLIEFSWVDNHTSEVDYEFVYSIDGGQERSIIIPSTTSNATGKVYTTTSIGLAELKTINAKVRMRWELGTSNFAEKTVLHNLEAPKNVKYVAVTNGMQISWDASPLADSYKVFAEDLEIATTSTTSTLITNELNCNVHVVAYKSTFISSPSPSVFIKSKPNAPVNFQVAFDELGGEYDFNVSFVDNSNIETGYRVEYSVDNGVATKIEIPADTTTSGQTITVNFKTTVIKDNINIRVIAINELGENDTTEPIKLYMSPQPRWSYLAETNEVLLDWEDKFSFRTGYKVQYYVNGLEYFYDVVDCTNTPSGGRVQHRFSLNPFATATVRICCISNQDHLYSEPISVSKETDLTLLAPPNFAYEWVGQGAIKFTWDDNYTVENGFEFTYSIDEGAYTTEFIPTTTQQGSGSYSMTKVLQPYQSIIAKVRMKWDLNVSEYTTLTVIYVPVEAEPIEYIIRTRTDTGFLLEWGVQNFVEKYKIHYTLDGKETIYETRNNTYVIDVDYTNEKEIQVYVVAHLTGGITSDKSATLTFKPTNLLRLVNTIQTGKLEDEYHLHSAFSSLATTEKYTLNTNTWTEFEHTCYLNTAYIEQFQMLYKDINTTIWWSQAENHYTMEARICHPEETFIKTPLASTFITLCEEEYISENVIKTLIQDGYPIVMDINKPRIATMGDSITAGHPNFWE